MGCDTVGEATEDAVGSPRVAPESLDLGLCNLLLRRQDTGDRSGVEERCRGREVCPHLRDRGSSVPGHNTFNALSLRKGIGAPLAPREVTRD